LLCCLGLVAGLLVGGLLGFPWWLVISTLGFILGAIVDIWLLKHVANES
jgi:hypothetical protein